MALITCKECQAKISDSAPTCPQCGAKRPKAASRLQIAFVGVLVIGIGIAVSKPGTTAATAGAAPAPTQTAEQAAYRAKESAFADQQAKAAKARAQFAASSIEAVMSSLRDPESAKFTYLGVNEEGNVSCLQYRAKNGFGGMNNAFAVIANNKATNKQADWKKYCSGALHDMLAAAS